MLVLFWLNKKFHLKHIKCFFFFFYSKRTVFPFFEETDRLNFLSFSKYAHPILKIISSLVISFMLLLHNPCMNIHGPCLPCIISFICSFFSVLLNTKMLLNVLIYTPPSDRFSSCLFLFMTCYWIIIFLTLIQEECAWSVDGHILEVRHDYL